MLRVNRRPVGEALVLHLDGDLQTPCGDSAFLEAVARFVGEGHRLVLADLSAVRSADAAGLGALVRARNLLVAVGGELQLTNPNRFVRELLRLTKLHTVIRVVSLAPRKYVAGRRESPAQGVSGDGRQHYARV